METKQLYTSNPWYLIDDDDDNKSWCSMGYQRYDCSETTLLLVSCIRTFLVLLNAISKYLIHSFRTTSLMSFYHCTYIVCDSFVHAFNLSNSLFYKYSIFVCWFLYGPNLLSFSARKHSPRIGFGNPRTKTMKTTLARERVK